MVRKKKSDEYEAKIQQALVVLGEVSEDSTTPRNIRRSAKDAMSALQSPEYTPAVRASNAVSMLDEILQDPKTTAGQYRCFSSAHGHTPFVMRRFCVGRSSLLEDYPSAFRNETALMQNRNPLGSGPSGNTWPR